MDGFYYIYISVNPIIDLSICTALYISSFNLLYFHFKSLSKHWACHRYYFASLTRLSSLGIANKIAINAMIPINTLTQSAIIAPV